MDEIVDIDTKDEGEQWSSGQTPKDPSEFYPYQAVEAFLKQLNEGEIDADHVVIIYRDEDRDATGWFQAGTLGPLAQLGLLEQAKDWMLRQNG